MTLYLSSGTFLKRVYYKIFAEIFAYKNQKLLKIRKFVEIKSEFNFFCQLLGAPDGFELGDKKLEVENLVITLPLIRY